MKRECMPVDLDGSGLDLHDVKRGLASPTTNGLEWAEEGLSVNKPVSNLSNTNTTNPVKPHTHTHQPSNTNTLKIIPGFIYTVDSLYIPMHIHIFKTTYCVPWREGTDVEVSKVDCDGSSGVSDGVGQDNERSVESHVQLHPVSRLLALPDGNSLQGRQGERGRGREEEGERKRERETGRERGKFVGERE